MNPAHPSRFNVRVYFVLFHPEGDKVLVSDEIIQKFHYTKFPGGGLEFGEGPIDAAKREAIEELGQEIQVTSHLYTTHFFIQSQFKREDQVIAIYYSAKLVQEPRFRIAQKPFDFVQQTNNEESFRWVSLETLKESDFHFPSDKELLRVLKQH